MRRRLWFAVAAIAALTACSSGTTETPSSQQGPTGESPFEGTAQTETPEGGPGVYVGTTETGAVIRVDIPAEPSPAIEEVERFRVAAGAPRFRYLTAEFDNRRGSAEIYLLDTYITVVDAQSEQHRIGNVFAPDAAFQRYVLNDVPRRQETAAYALFNRAYDLQTVLPGARAEALYATADDEMGDPSIVYVTNDLGGMTRLTKQ